MADSEEFVDVEASFPSGFSPPSKSSTLSKSIRHELNTLWANTNEAMNFTIFRTPHNISQIKNNLFEPTAISIGPFHRNKVHLRALEEQKKRFLKDFLNRGDHISLDRCISEMESLETRTRKCYSESFPLIGSNEFVKMMLLDGCFLLEYFFRIFRNNSIIEVGWNNNFIDRDLLLLENQIPFFIVEKLYDICTSNPTERVNFVKRIAYTFLSQIQTKDYTDSIVEISNPPPQIHHLVHLCYHYFVPKPEEPVVLSSKSFDLTTKFKTSCIEFSLSVALPKSNGNISLMVIPSATELKQKGLKFTPKSNPKHMLDISFEYGVLQIPQLTITDDTKPFFANLIAFEHSKYGKEQSPFTSFVYFLDNLVNTQNDVTILQERGIIENWLSSEEELTHFLNQVTEGGVLGEGHYLAKLNLEVNKYIESTWNRNRAKLFSDYFSNPWATISVIAAFILLVLTLVQSFFAVFAYFRPPSS